MPVVALASPPHPRIGELLIGVADTIAEALGLAEGDVIVVHQPTGASAASGDRDARASAAWHLVSVSGSDRGAESTGRALAAAEECVRRWCAGNGIDCEGVWAQWLTPLPNGA